jgi:predicted HicB family RNase H-like nuclease
MNFSITIEWIQKLISWFVGSPLIAAVMAALIQDFKDEGEQILKVALEAIKEAASQDMKETSKFGYVYGRVKEQIPKASESLLNTSIEAALRLYKRA